MAAGPGRDAPLLVGERMKLAGFKGCGAGISPVTAHPAAAPAGCTSSRSRWSRQARRCLALAGQFRGFNARHWSALQAGESIIGARRMAGFVCRCPVAALGMHRSAAAMIRIARDSRLSALYGYHSALGRWMAPMQFCFASTRARCHSTVEPGASRSANRAGLV